MSGAGCSGASNLHLAGEMIMSRSTRMQHGSRHYCFGNSRACLQTECVIHMRMTSSFLKKTPPQSLHGGDNAVVCKNVHFETRFQNFAFQSLEMPLSCKSTVKTYKCLPLLVENDLV